ncbi:MAG: hypothetical protein M0Q51_09610 [Bacteroidales bacterium]|nr:hypothetical protein [Bacteroidales bacterium]
MLLIKNPMIKAFILTLILLPSFLFSQGSLKIRLNAFMDEWHTDAARADMQAYAKGIKGHFIK